MCSLQAFAIENVTVMALITADMRMQSVHGVHRQTVLTVLVTKKNMQRQRYRCHLKAFQFKWRSYHQQNKENGY